MTITTDQILIPAATAVLVDLLDPFGCPPWDGVAPFGPADVHVAAVAGRFHTQRIVDGHTTPTDVHLARIAYLVRTWPNDGSDPPLVEVVEPNWLVVHDGYHRICAAVVRGEPAVIIDLGGDLDAAEDMFEIHIP